MHHGAGQDELQWVPSCTGWLCLPQEQGRGAGAWGPAEARGHHPGLPPPCPLQGLPCPRRTLPALTLPVRVKMGSKEHTVMRRGRKIEVNCRSPCIFFMRTGHCPCSPASYQVWHCSEERNHPRHASGTQLWGAVDGDLLLAVQPFQHYVEAPSKFTFHKL